MARISMLLSLLAVAVSGSIYEDLLAADVHRATPAQVVLNYQNQASKAHFDHDNCQNPLFKSVDASVLANPSVAAMEHLVPFYTRDASISDPNSAQRITAALYFIDSLNQTKVFSLGWQYLQSKGLASSDYKIFQSTLIDMWFSVFARGNGAGGSCGFEAVFCGEFLGDDTIGLSNWVRFYRLEAEKTIDYHGFFMPRQKDVQLSLQYALTDNGVKKANPKSLLFHSSPEFEVIAYTICALEGKGECSMMIEGNEVVLNVPTTTLNGALLITDAYPSVGSVSTSTQTSKTTTKGQAVTDFQAFVDAMRSSDVDKPAPSQYHVEWGTKAGPKQAKPLLTGVDEKLFERPVYAALKTIFDNNILKPDVCTAESDYKSGFKKTMFTNLLDTWANTTVFGHMHNYLVKHGKADADVVKFKAFLYQFWYGPYSRCKPTLGSSGFEHVFSGEWKSGTVDGQHDWMRYYLLQKQDAMTYLGYYTNDGQLTGTFKYNWLKEVKKTGGFMFGTSPVFDYSLFTACALTQPGANKCRFVIDGFQLAVTSYTQDCANGGMCLATSYPEDHVK